VMVYNRYLNNRPLGSTKFSLHRLLDEPSIQLSASLVDAFDKPLKVNCRTFIIKNFCLNKINWNSFAIVSLFVDFLTLIFQIQEIKRVKKINRQYDWLGSQLTGWILCIN
jgi:hypothetical protein